MLQIKPKDLIYLELCTDSNSEESSKLIFLTTCRDADIISDLENL